MQGRYRRRGGFELPNLGAFWTLFGRTLHAQGRSELVAETSWPRASLIETIETWRRPPHRRTQTGHHAVGDNSRICLAAHHGRLTALDDRHRMMPVKVGCVSIRRHNKTRCDRHCPVPEDVFDVARNGGCISPNFRRSVLLMRLFAHSAEAARGQDPSQPLSSTPRGNLTK